MTIDDGRSSDHITTHHNLKTRIDLSSSSDGQDEEEDVNLEHDDMMPPSPQPGELDEEEKGWTLTSGAYMHGINL